MRKHEIIFDSLNTDSYTKPIRALVITPDNLTPNTGAMLFTHGWGGNRFQHQDKMEATADKYDLVCVSTEYRQSGYEHNPVTGLGATRPYDASLYQTLDTLNALRTVLDTTPGLNRNRLFHYGGSQGGHIALLSTIFAPATFAFVYASCPVTHLEPKMQEWAGRLWAEPELAVRNTLAMADRISCPVYLEYGTADETVPHETHGQVLSEKLRDNGKLARLEVYEGGTHSLEPTITKLEAYERMAPEPLTRLTRSNEDDFLTQSQIEIPAADRTLFIDWSKEPSDPNLLTWR